MTELPNDIESLKALIGRLLEENRRLKAENAELRRRLGMDSSNSDKPPSSDGYKKRSVKPGLPRDKNSSNGGPEGHKGDTLKRVEQPEHVQIHIPEQCGCCGRHFMPEEAQVVQSRQVFDLPEPKLEVTEHRSGQVECCGRVQCGQYPVEVMANVQYGPGVRALITKLSVEHKMPMKQISSWLEDMYGYEVNRATIEGMVMRGYHLAEAIESQSMASLYEAATVHFDETGVRVEGQLQWLHTASTETHTHWFIHKKRGGEALNSEASVLKDFTGTAVHDCWSPYFNFEDAWHVLCGAPLWRELAGLEENGSLWAGEMHEFLLDLYKMPRPILAQEEVRKHYHILLEPAQSEEPPPQPGKRGKPKQSPGRNLLNRLRQHEDGVLAFALDWDVPFTNNQAERDLRPAKVKQKVSGCFRTQVGACAYARLQAAISTFRKPGMNVFATLRDLFARRPVVLLL
jgi:transposase